MSESKICLNTSPRLTRGIIYDRHAHGPHRVSAEVWLDVFQVIYDTLERHPMASLAETAPGIIALLDKV